MHTRKGVHHISFWIHIFISS